MRRLIWAFCWSQIPHLLEIPCRGSIISSVSIETKQRYLNAWHGLWIGTYAWGWKLWHCCLLLGWSTLQQRSELGVISGLCWLLLLLWDSVIFLCFVVRYFMSILVLQSSWWARESWLLCLVCLPGVSWLLCGSSLWWHWFLCSLWLWYFPIILTISGIVPIGKQCRPRSDVIERTLLFAYRIFQYNLKKNTTLKTTLETELVLSIW